jgi:hypothetical protein
MKETNEIVEGLVEAFKAGKGTRDIIKDGVDANDIMPAISLMQEQFKKINTYSEAIKDADKAIEEIKNASKEDLIALFIRLVKAVEEVEKA